MNKKGFTFIELLAVIILIGLVIGIAIPSIRYADKKFHEKAYKTKIELIKLLLMQLMVLHILIHQQELVIHL